MKFYMIAFLSAALLAGNIVETKEAKAKKAHVVKSLSQSDALDLLNNAVSQVLVGGVYCSSYIPSDLYQVLTVAIDAVTLEPVVVYVALFGVNAVWVRPVSEFVELVDVDGAAVPHFQLIDQADVSLVVADVDVAADVAVAEELVADQVEQAAEDLAVQSAEVALELAQEIVEKAEEALEAVQAAAQSAQEALQSVEDSIESELESL